MEFAVLAAGIDARRKVAKQILIVRSSGERGIEMGCIDARQYRFETELDKGLREFRRVPFPDGEKPLHSKLRQVLFPVDLEVFQKNVAERNRLNPLAQTRLQQRAHAGFINFIG